MAISFGIPQHRVRNSQNLLMSPTICLKSLMMKVKAKQIIKAIQSSRPITNNIPSQKYSSLNDFQIPTISEPKLSRKTSSETDLK